MKNSKMDGCTKKMKKLFVFWKSSKLEYTQYDERAFKVIYNYES